VAHPLPPTLQHRLITDSNPTGSFTINDLELAASIIGATMACHSSPALYHHLLIGVDNTAACAWLNKGSTSSSSAPAFLLHQLARLRRASQFSLSATYVPGHNNNIADCCSRLLHLSDTNFLAVMNSTFPVQPSWTLVTPPTELLSLMSCALLNRLQPLASTQNDKAVPPRPGTFGLPSARTCAVTPTCQPSPIPSPCYKFLPIDTETAHWLPVALQSNLEQWKMPFVASARRSPHWAAQTQAYNPLAN
jgi:hypothetical protein